MLDILLGFQIKHCNCKTCNLVFCLLSICAQCEVLTACMFCLLISHLVSKFVHLSFLLSCYFGQDVVERNFISIRGISCLNTSSWDLKITASVGNEERPSTSFVDVAGSSEMAHKEQNSGCKTEKHAQGR